MRQIYPLLAVGALLTLGGCGHVFVLSRSQSRVEMLSLTSRVIIGVIESHEFESWPFFRVRFLPMSGRRSTGRSSGVASVWKPFFAVPRVGSSLMYTRSFGQEARLATG